MNRVPFLLSIALSVASLALVSCTAPIPGHLPQSGGNGPLVVELTLATGVPGVATVRGPDKGDGERGGVTASFTGVGGPMCVILDPEDIYAYAQAGTPDNVDDGDSDLFAGRAADYTGTPGIVLGDFLGDYIDPLGVPHALDQNQCVQVGTDGIAGAHGGMAAAEFCTINTEAGTPYIILAETFSVPNDDDLLTVAMMVTAGGCPSVDEFTLDGDNN